MSSTRVSSRSSTTAPDVDLEQQVRAALEVEPEVDLLVRQPVGQALHLLAREQVRQAQHQADHADPEDQGDLPAGKAQHRGGYFLPNSCAIRPVLAPPSAAGPALRRRRLGLAQDIGDRAARDPHPDVLGDLDQRARRPRP